MERRYENPGKIVNKIIKGHSDRFLEVGEGKMKKSVKFYQVNPKNYKDLNPSYMEQIPFAGKCTVDINRRFM